MKKEKNTEINQSSKVLPVKKITPMMEQFNNIKKKHKDKLLLFRMGDFYETFDKDAEIAAKVLGITLTARNKTQINSTKLAGFPAKALNQYLEKLIKANLKVVIAEQVEDPKLAKGLVKREVVDIITPGSVIDDSYLKNEACNYMASVSFFEQKAGLSFVDVSTGDFIFTEVNMAELANEINRIQPVELVVATIEDKGKFEELKTEHSPVITVFDFVYFDMHEAEKILLNQFEVFDLSGLAFDNRNHCILACGLALCYLSSLKQSQLKHINSIRHYNLGNYMQFDESTVRNLELTKSMRYASKKCSLLMVLDKTKTPMGTRLLTNWLLQPLLDETEINERLNLVGTFKNKIHFTNDLRIIFDRIGDLSRLIAKLGAKKATPRDLLALAQFLETSNDVKKILTLINDDALKNIASEIDDYSDICTFIINSLVEAPPITITEGNIIAVNYHDELDELRDISKNGKFLIASLEEQEKLDTGISSLKIAYNKVFGYYIEVTKANKDKVPEHYIRKQTLVNSERYISPKLKDYESKVLGAEERIKSLEYELFIEIRDKLFEEIKFMQKYVDVIATLDVLTNFAFISNQNSYVKPEITKSGILSIKNSRHPVIEEMIGFEGFIPNDVFLDNKGFKISLITGPNMAGKSTYLRQIGLTAIMAQIGCFVPADEAELPIFDRVFTRVGASDNLAQGQSTFLVEMLETANILNNATGDSLIILDEIGRGTSTFDGLSIAWSIVEFIHNNPKLKAKTLFATHYHELTELEQLLGGVKNYNITVSQNDDDIIFLRKIERGAAKQSFGIQVANLAGMPKPVIKRAKELLTNLEETEISAQGLAHKAKKQLKGTDEQPNIFDAIFDKTEEHEKIIDEIKALNLNKITPFEALKYLTELQDKI